jgi:hypothetical protein
MRESHFLNQPPVQGATEFPRGLGPVRSGCLLWVCAITAISGLVTFAQPTDNPLASHYMGDGRGYPVWTDRIHWDQVYDVTSAEFGAIADDGLCDFAAFESARDAAHAAGGGVVYFPAGTYDFSCLPDAGGGAGIGPHGRGLMLPSGVVIRGAAPPGDRWARPTDAYPEDGRLQLPTRFVFAFQDRDGGELPLDWALVGLDRGPTGNLRDVHDVGICWVELVGAVVHFGADQDWADTLGSSGWLPNNIKNNWPGEIGSGLTWADRVPDGTHPADMLYGTRANFGAVAYEGAGAGRLVFGVQLTDATIVADWYVPVGNNHPTFGSAVEADDFHIHRWSGRIAITGSDVFVANNCIPMAERNFVHQQATIRRISSGSGFAWQTPAEQRRILLDYGQVIGIDINKNHLALSQPREPGTGYYGTNVHVWDNFVFNRGSHGFTVSGQWATLINNHNKRFYFGKVVPAAYGIDGYNGQPEDATAFITRDGFGVYDIETGDDFNSRGYDLGGRNLWVHGNSVVNTGSLGNDGEAIMGQRYLGFEVYSWAFTDNFHGNSNYGTGTTGEAGWIGSYDMHNYGFLGLRNTTPGWIGHVKAGGNNLYDFALVDNITGQGLRADFGGVDDIDLSSHELPMPLPLTPVVNLMADGSRMIEYPDFNDNDLGYRIARRIDGSQWCTIAYRPRQGGLSNADPALRDPQSPSTPLNSLNPPAWRDYTVPSDAQTVEYAVLAINRLDLIDTRFQQPLAADRDGNVHATLFAGYNYKLWQSTDLASWREVSGWLSGNATAEAAQTSLIHTDSASAIPVFYRLEVRRSK